MNEKHPISKKLYKSLKQAPPLILLKIPIKLEIYKPPNGKQHPPPVHENTERGNKLMINPIDSEKHKGLAQDLALYF